MTTTEIAPDIPAEPDPTGTEPAKGGSWGLGVVLIAISVVALVLAGVLIVRLVSPEEASGEVVTYLVPAGTADKVAQGEKIEIMPREVRLDVGDSLVIRNDDDQTALVGPYVVKAGSTLTQKFQRPQYLVGECSISGSGEIKIIVT
jgi:hypothetical protein